MSTKVNGRINQRMNGRLNRRVLILNVHNMCDSVYFAIVFFLLIVECNNKILILVYKYKLN